MDTITTFSAPTVTNLTPKLTSSNTPPTGAAANDLWFDTKTGFLFIWYFDGNTYQWVVSNPGRGADIPPPSSVSPVEILANPGIILVPNPLKSSGTIGVDAAWLNGQIPTALPPNGVATGDLTGSYPAPTIKANVNLAGAPTTTTAATADSTTKVATTAFVKAQGYQTVAGGSVYQPADPGLTALAGLDATAGLVEETALDTFTKRPIGVSTGPSIPTTALADARYAPTVHTHTSSQITDFAEATDDRVAALLTAGTNITLTYNDASNQLTVAAAAAPTTLPPSGSAGGDLTGTYPNPQLAWISRVAGKTLTINNTLVLAGVDGSTLNIAAGGTLGTAAFTNSTAYLAATAAAGGALSGNYPNPQLVGGPLSNYAPLASPVFTGNPTAPTPAPGDNDTSVATTAFVAASYAPLASPVLTGNPTAPTPLVGDNDTSIATTAFVATAVSAAVGGSTPTGPAGGGLAGTYPNPTIKPSVTNGEVLTTTAGVSTWGPTPASPPNGAAGGDLAGSYPNPTVKASVGLTGTPTAPTVATADSTTSIATTAFVKAQGYLTTATAGTTYQPLDAELTALAGLSATAGLVEMTGVAAFTKRLLGTTNATDVLTRADGDGRYLLPATAVTTYLALAGGTMTGKETTMLSGAGGAGFNLPHGVAPTAPVNGDLWTTTAGLLARINGVTVGPMISTASIPAALPPNGAASGDLAGSYPSPTVKASVGLTGTPTAPTVATADSSVSIATTAFVKAQGYQTVAGMPAALPPSGAAGGDLAGTYPNPTLSWISRTAGKTVTYNSTQTHAGVDGKTFTLNNSITLAGTDGATLNVGAGGTLGTAAFTAASAYQAAGAAAGGVLAGTYPNPAFAKGTVQLWDEQVLASTNTILSVAFPTGAKRLELEFYLWSNTNVDFALVMQLMQGATPVATSIYYTQWLLGAAAAASAAATNAAAFWSFGTSSIFSGVAKLRLVSTTWSGNLEELAISQVGGRNMLAAGFDATVTGVTGIRVLSNGGAMVLGVGSFLRLYAIA